MQEQVDALPQPGGGVVTIEGRHTLTEPLSLENNAMNTRPWACDECGERPGRLWRYEWHNRVVPMCVHYCRKCRSIAPPADQVKRAGGSVTKVRNDANRKTNHV